MTEPPASRPWWRAAAAWLDATPSELLGVAVLLAGSVAAAALVWTGGVPRPAPAHGAGSAAEPAVPSPAPLRVHVAGAVAAPGLVTLPAGSRVEDAVRAAGGARADADLDALNLARVVEDGEQVTVPVAGEPGSPAGGGGSGATGTGGRVDLNRASATELEELPGIGPVLAGRIVAWRDEHGPFREPGDLREVPGIGERTFQLLADLVTV